MCLETCFFTYKKWIICLMNFSCLVQQIYKDLHSLICNSKNLKSSASKVFQRLVTNLIWTDIEIYLSHLVWIFIYFAVEILTYLIIGGGLPQTLLGVYVVWYMYWITFLKSENFIILKHLALRVSDKGLWIYHLLSNLEGIMCFLKNVKCFYILDSFPLCVLNDF